MHSCPSRSYPLFRVFRNCCFPCCSIVLIRRYCPLLPQAAGFLLPGREAFRAARSAYHRYKRGRGCGMAAYLRGSGWCCLRDPGTSCYDPAGMVHSGASGRLTLPLSGSFLLCWDNAQIPGSGRPVNPDQTGRQIKEQAGLKKRQDYPESVLSPGAGSCPGACTRRFGLQLPAGVKPGRDHCLPACCRYSDWPGRCWRYRGHRVAASYRLPSGM